QRVGARPPGPAAGRVGEGRGEAVGPGDRPGSAHPEGGGGPAGLQRRRPAPGRGRRRPSAPVGRDPTQGRGAVINRTGSLPSGPAQVGAAPPRPRRYDPLPVAVPPTGRHTSAYAPPLSSRIAPIACLPSDRPGRHNTA